MFRFQRTLGHKSQSQFVSNEKIEAEFINAQKSYTSWKLHTLPAGYQQTELLTDHVSRAGRIDEFNFMAKRPKISKDDALLEIRRLSPWTYYLNIHGVSTEKYGTFNASTITYHRYRNDLIIGNLLRMFNGDFSKLSAIDIGCNCGFFSSELASNGMASVLGVDLREENIVQAEFVRDAFDLKNVSFLKKNVKELAGTAKFDIVLNLGLMYHLSTPLEVMQHCFDITNKVCVIDSVTHKEPFSGFFSVTNKNIKSPIEGDLSFELQPTYRGLIDTIYASGFDYLIEVMTWVDEHVDQYSDLSRRCFFAFKDKSFADHAVRLLRGLS